MKKKKLRRNPIMGFPVPGDPDYIPRKKSKFRKTRTKKQRIKLDKKRQYKERAKRLRPFFKEVFSASVGFDLRKPGTWTPQQKAKVTRYFRVMAPNITGEFEVRRYRIPENQAAAVDASLQEKPLKGQTGVAFRVDPGERLDVKIRRGVATVKKHGIQRIKLKFDKKAFMQDPKAEVERMLAQTDANTFQILVGGQGQNKVLTREDVMTEIVRLVESYARSRIRPDQAQRPFTDWLNGLIAYPGAKKKTKDVVDRFVASHKILMAQRRKDHYDQLSADGQNISVATFRRRRTLRKKKVLRKRGK